MNKQRGIGERIVRWVRFNGIRLFRIRAASERVARGFAVGLIINFLPTFGFGVLISGFVARTFGGNVVAGFVGGALLTWAWPFLFFLNLRVGALVLHKRAPIADPDQLTDTMLSKVVWGQAFSIGAFINSLVVGLAAYLLLRLLYHEIRQPVLNRLRRRFHRRLAVAP